jgi:uncharacterized protein YjbI with pentapeptide repeats
MNKRVLGTVIGGLLIAPGVYAEPVNVVQTLIKTRACPRCDLSRADLRSLDLSNVNLTGANLSQANLTNTNLRGANLSGAIATRALFNGANLSGANLSQANLTDAALLKVDLRQTNLEGTVLSNAQLDNPANPNNTPFLNAQNQPDSSPDLAPEVEPSNPTGADSVPETPPANPDTSSQAPSPQESSSPADTRLKKTPLQLPPVQLFNLETANQQPKGSLLIVPGTRVFLNDELGGGAGLQLNTGAIYGGVTDRLQLGFSGQLYDDILAKRVNGLDTNVFWVGGGPNLKYNVFKSDRWSVGIGASIEGLRVTRGGSLFLPSATATSVTNNILLGSLQVPVTYSVTPKFQLHLVPGVSFFPNSLNNGDFYGTLFKIGAGLSWQPLERLNFFADIQAPLGPGDNAVRSSDGSLFKRVVWSAGLRFLVNPAVGLDLYATNSFGYTPATSILAALPDGGQPAIGFNLSFTPDFGQGYAATFRKQPLQELTARDQQLLLDGFTLSTADTLLPRRLRLRGGIGEGLGFNVATSITNDVQLEFLGEDVYNAAEISRQSLGEAFKLGAAAKIRLLDQVQGDPFSLSIKGSFAQSISEPIGYSAGELIFQYRPISQLAFTVNPKLGIRGDDKRVGVGLGVNYQLWKGFQLIGEVTPMATGEKTVWTAGIRYLDPKYKIGIDVYAGNAIGQYSYAGLVAQPDPVIGVNLHWLW